MLTKWMYSVLCAGVELELILRSLSLMGCRRCWQGGGEGGGGCHGLGLMPTEEWLKTTSVCNVT